MKSVIYTILIASFIVLPAVAQIDPNNWPPNTDFTQEIHFWSADGFLQVPAAGANMAENLTILTGGDQVTSSIEIAGHQAVQSVAAYMNVADDLNFVWIDYPEIDILVEYFANQGSVRDSSFLIGTLPAGNLRTSPSTYDRVTDQYEWRLFRVDNVDGKFGFVVDSSIAGSTYGGVNGGTVRFQNSTNLIVRAIAFAPSGTFGTLEEINLPPVTIEFDPDLYANAASWDIQNNVVDGLNLYQVTGGAQESVIENNIGPANDRRRAVRAAFDNGTDGFRDVYLNWEILNEHFGPTTQPATRIKVCAVYYDDPAAAGTTFGPEAYTGPGGVIAFFPADQRRTLEGSGRWRTAIWFIDGVKFTGVNVPTQAAARFHFTAPVYLSSFRIGVIRTSGIYTGQDPLPDCTDFDPDPYQIYAQWDLQNNIEEGLTLGSNGGDQEWITDENIGPAGDKRSAVRSAQGEGLDPNPDSYINWAILNELFGPSSQPNAVFKVCVDYYDDPAIVGAAFGPEVYQSERGGIPQFAFVPAADRLALEGTDQWRTYSWQINDMNFTGVNVGPQGAARFYFSGPVYISRVQYAVIRVTGQNAGVDMLANCGENAVNVSEWPIH